MPSGPSKETFLMKTPPKQVVWPDPIIGYREFVDRTCRAIFEDSTGQYVMADDGERIYGVYLTPEVDSPLPAIVRGQGKPLKEHFTENSFLLCFPPNLTVSSPTGFQVFFGGN